MTVKTGQAIAGIFATVDGTGALTAATGDPAGALYVAGVASGTGVSISGANPYKWAVAALPALTSGQLVQVYITATVDAIATGGVVFTDVADTKLVSDLVDPAVATIQSGLATSGNISDLQTHGDSEWATAAGFAVAGDAMDLIDGAIVAATIADGAIDAGAIATDAITAAKIAADAIGASELAATAAAEIADAVWDELIAGHTTAGSMADELSDVGEDVWGYSDGRTLTQSSATLATISEVEITQYRGDTWDIDLADLGGMTGYGKVWFTVKEHASDYDAESLVQVEYSVGLTYINKAAATTAANGSVTVTDAASGDITIVVDESETAKLPVRNDLHYDVQALISGAVTTLASGTFNIAADYSRATA